MVQVFRVIVFAVLLAVGYVLANAAFTLAVDKLPPAITNYTRDWHLPILVSTFTGIVFPPSMIHFRERNVWYVAALGSGFLGGLHYLVFSLDLLRDPLIWQAIGVQFGCWTAAGLSAYFGTRRLLPLNASLSVSR